LLVCTGAGGGEVRSALRVRRVDGQVDGIQLCIVDARIAVGVEGGGRGLWWEREGEGRGGGEERGEGEGAFYGTGLLHKEPLTHLLPLERTAADIREAFLQAHEFRGLVWGHPGHDVLEQEEYVLGDEEHDPLEHWRRDKKSFEGANGDERMAMKEWR
jgi:hypothetical protein